MDDWLKCWQHDEAPQVGLAPVPVAKRGRGRPPKDPFLAQLQGGSDDPARRTTSANRAFLDTCAAEVARMRRDILDRHRGDNRDGGMQARRSTIAADVMALRHLGPSSMAAWIIRQPKYIGLTASAETLRRDVAAIRKAGRGSPQRKS